jgi:rhodanese-related sulfurtransferase
LCSTISFDFYGFIIRAIFLKYNGGLLMKSLRLNLSIILFLLSMIALSFFISEQLECTVATAWAEEATLAFKTIPVSQANEMLGKIGVIFLDVREPGEFQSGHIPGAMNVPLSSVESQIGKLVPDKAATMVVYCQGGRRSVTASQTLTKMGYKNILDMDGGYKAWLKAGYSVQQLIEKSK